MPGLADTARSPGRVVFRAIPKLPPYGDPVPIRDEKVFTDDEFVAAMSLILPPDRAREEGLAFNSLPDLHGFETATGAELAAAPANGPRVYDGDLLDLLSLVSDSCAERAWKLMGVSPEEGAERREAMRRRVEEAQAYLHDNPPA